MVRGGYETFDILSAVRSERKFSTANQLNKAERNIYLTKPGTAPDSGSIDRGTEPSRKGTQLIYAD